MMLKQQNMTVFYADRLIRLVVDHDLEHQPFAEKQVITPTGSVYTSVISPRGYVVHLLLDIV
ncbi:hypothetical protein LguiB_030279 [Lonicera macranthoides]